MVDVILVPGERRYTTKTANTEDHASYSKRAPAIGGAPSYYPARSLLPRQF